MLNFLFFSLSSKSFLQGIIFFISILMGSIPFGLIVARFFKVKSLTTQGSGNIGASNVSRVIGFWPAGFITFVLDVAKGSFAVVLAMPMGCRFLAMIGEGSFDVDHIELSTMTLWLAGFFSILGHCFSPWLHLKGGKGVATGLGVMLILSPPSALFGILAFILTFLQKRIASLSSIAGLILTAVAYLVMNPVHLYLWVGVGMLYLILFRHEANIDALLENREKSFQ